MRVHVTAVRQSHARRPRGPLTNVAIAFMSALLGLGIGIPSVALASPQRIGSGIVAPAGLHAKAVVGVAVADVGWHGSPLGQSVSGYRVWRSQAANGVFDPIGSTATTSFRDYSGRPGRAYFYRVTAVGLSGRESDLSTPVGPIRSTWLENPHATHRTGGLCLTCHALHKAATTDILQDVGARRPGEVAICESCHDGEGARTDVKSGPVDSFALASGHRLEEATRGADLTNSCSSCHSPHADVRTRPGLNATRIRRHRVARDNSWCLSCHDDGNSWRPGVPPTSRPVRDAVGYPVLGTFPGASVYADPRRDSHVRIPATGAGRTRGDCLICHAAHRGSNAYDGLLRPFRPEASATVAADRVSGEYAALCLDCHGGAPVWLKAGAADIRRYVTRPASESATYSGHRVRSWGGLLPAGSPLPCYDCHNPHGSARGNASMISDELGRRLQTKTAAGVRAFCLTCHSTIDGKVWDGTADTYRRVGAQRVEGLRRDGSDGSFLRLPSVGGAAHESSSPRSCYDCHGKDYAVAGGHNVHDPWVGALTDPLGAGTLKAIQRQRDRVAPATATPSR